MGRRISSAALAIVLCLTGVTVQAAVCQTAQTVRGMLVEEGTERPIGGAFIVLLDEEGGRPGWDIGTLTDNDGRFVLRVPDPGRYRLRAERIGFKNTLSDVIALGARREVEVTIVAPVEAVKLDELVVTGETRCDVPPDVGRETVEIWEEARKALAVVNWGAQGILRYQVLRYQRELTPHRLRVREERTWPWFWNARGSLFTSRSAEDLAARGYVRPLPADSFVFYAPDAAVVLSESFADQHCFAVREGHGDREGYIGLAFEPVPGRDLPDIEGVLWLDKETAELRDLAYRYTNLPLPVWDEDIGGDIEFERLPSGAWIVSRWSIRSPVVEFYDPLHPLDDRHRLAAVLEEGGTVVEIRTADGERVRRWLGTTLAGSVYDSIRAEPLVGATVFLVGTDRTALTDHEGRFEIDGLLEGEYSVGFSHPSLDSLTITPQPVAVSITRDRMTTVQLSSPSLRSILGSLRRDRGRQEGTESPAVVLGRVLDDESGEPVETVEVRLVGEGEDLVRVTDGEGAFLFARVKPGTYEVILTHLAYGTRTDTVEVGRGELVRYHARLGMQPIELAPLVVMVERSSVSPMLLGFYERMSLGHGHFITREDIELRQPYQITQMIGDMAGVRLRRGWSAYSYVVEFRRYQRPGVSCPAAVYVDRMYMGGGEVNGLPALIDQLVIPPDVEAVEVYDGPGSLPADFGGSRAGCGVIVIWTRRGT